MRPEASVEELRAALGGPVPEHGSGSEEVIAELIVGGRAGHHGHARRTILRLRDRRRSPGGRCGRLADHDLGSERGSDRADAERRGGRGDRGRMAPRAAPAAGRRVRGGRHGLPDGARDRPGGRPPARARAGRLGSPAGRSAGRAAHPRPRRRRAPRDRRSRAALPRHRDGADRGARRRRPGSTPAGGAAGRARGRGRAPRSSAPRRAASTRARSTRWRRSRTPSRAPAPGSTSTGLSGSGRQRHRASGTSSPEPSAPTRGRPTRTSGSTSPTTAGSRSAPIPSRTAPR